MNEEELDGQQAAPEEDLLLEAQEPPLSDGDPGDEDPVDTPPSDVEERAARMGWAPKDKWRGDPDKWKSAEEFIAFAEETPSVARERLRKQDETIADMQKQLAVVTKKLTDADKRGYERAIADIKAQKKVAVEAGDVEAFERLEQEEEGLRKETAPKPEPEAPAEPPEVVAWKAENKWFDKDPALTQVAVAAYKAYTLEHPQGTIPDALEHAKRTVQRAYPEKFTNPNRGTAPKLGGSKPPANRNVKTAADLPPDARTAGEKFVRQGIFKDLNEYAKDYFSEEN